MTRSLICALACLIMVACDKPPKEVPVLVTKPIPKAPAECKASPPDDLAPMPFAKTGDTLDAYVARVAKTHRINLRLFRKVKSDKDICGVYINTLTSTGG